MTMPDFHVEQREGGSIFLRAVSDRGNQWIQDHGEPWTLVAGGALIPQPHVEGILERIHKDDLVCVGAHTVSLRKPLW